jgi:tRNA nucleotidyltransferase/poly(A) polymerase
MKLRNLLALIYKVSKDYGTSLPMICGGSVRDRYINSLNGGQKIADIGDLDITTGDDSIHILGKEIASELRKKFNIQDKEMDDGHRSLFLSRGDDGFKLDFSSNFVVPQIDMHLHELGITNPSSMQREMFSRDFTCNALLMTLDLKTIKDPTKKGFADIKAKVLKTCLHPDITFRHNVNRIVRIIYLAAKLGFDVDPEIIQWVIENKDIIRQSSDHYLTTNIDKALKYNAGVAVGLISQMQLWNTLPMTDNLYPYFKKQQEKTAHSSLRSSGLSAQWKRNMDLGENVFENLDKYKSIGDFRAKRRKKRKKILKGLKAGNK